MPTIANPIRRRSLELLEAAAREMGEIGAGTRRPARSVSRKYDEFYEAWMETDEAAAPASSGTRPERPAGALPKK